VLQARTQWSKCLHLTGEHPVVLPAYDGSLLYPRRASGIVTRRAERQSRLGERQRVDPGPDQGRRPSEHRQRATERRVPCYCTRTHCRWSLRGRFPYIPRAAHRRRDLHPLAGSPVPSTRGGDGPHPFERAYRARDGLRRDHPIAEARLWALGMAAADSGTGLLRGRSRTHATLLAGSPSRSG